MMQIGRGRELLGKLLLGGSMLALTTLLAACAGSGSSVGTDGGNVAGTFLPPPSTATNSTGLPHITSLSPTSLFPGELLTINGANFGDQQLDTSRIFFSSDGVSTTIDAGTVKRTGDWTNSQLRIAVPSAAVTGPVQVVLSSRRIDERRSNTQSINVKRAFDPNVSPKVVFINPAKGQFVGADTPITIVFDRPILATTLNTTAVSLSAVSAPDEALAQKDPPQDPCSFPFVCDLRADDLLKCTCSRAFSVSSITDISASLRATPRTAFQVAHGRFSGTTIVVSITNTIKADGSVDADGNPRALPGPDIPELGEVFFFFVN